MSCHHHTDAFAEANKEFFDKFAAQYDELAISRDRAKAVGKAAHKVFDFDPKHTLAMEFACGTGLVTRELVPYTNRVVGVDISSGSIDRFNANAKLLGIPEEKIQGYCVELKGEDGELDNQKFDVILCSQAYHHFESVNDITRMLAFFLRPGGSLIVFDYMHPDNAAKLNVEETIVGKAEDAQKMLRSHEVHHIVPHLHGVKEITMRQAVDSAGLAGFTFAYAFTSFRPDGDKQPFFAAKAVKRF